MASRSRAVTRLFAVVHRLHAAAADARRAAARLPRARRPRPGSAPCGRASPRGPRRPRGARRRPWPRRRGGRRRRRAGAGARRRGPTTTRSARLPASSEPSSVLHAQRARAAQGRHLQHGRGGRGGGIAGGVLGQQRGRHHLLEHVEVVVAGRAVGAQAQAHALGEHLAHRAPPPRRASCCSAGSGPRPRSRLLQQRAVARRRATRRARPSTPLRRKPRSRRCLGGRLAVPLAHLLLLVLRLGDVDEERARRTVGQRARGLERVRRCTGRPSAGATAAVTSGSPGPASAGTSRCRPAPRRWSCCRGRGTRSASRRPRMRMPGLLGSLRHLVLEVVHVHEGGGAGADHLQGGQARARLHERRGDVLLLGREDVAAAASPSASGRRPRRGTGPWARGVWALIRPGMTMPAAARRASSRPR